MYLLLLIWGFYFVWYLFVIIFPNSFDRMSEKTLREQRISYDSKLRYVYINKKAFPQLKCIAIQAIIFFLSNILYTIIIGFLLSILDNDLIINYISIGYLLLFLIITSTTIFIINLKK